jgi:hypothetical protein
MLFCLQYVISSKCDSRILRCDKVKINKFRKNGAREEARGGGGKKRFTHSKLDAFGTYRYYVYCFVLSLLLSHTTSLLEA